MLIQFLKKNVSDKKKNLSGGKMIKKIIIASGAIALMALPTSAFAQYVHHAPKVSIGAVIPTVPIETPIPESTTNTIMQLVPSWIPSTDSTPKSVSTPVIIEDPCGFSVAETREEVIAAIECMRN